MTSGPARIAWATTSGSSGKTTSTVTTAAILAERGQRVLVVDGDWQMDASRWLGLDETELPDDRRTLLDVLLDRDTITEAIAPSSVPGIDLLPSSPSLQEAARILAGTKGVEGQLRRALDTVEDAYDTILIDCRAGTEIPTVAGIVAATSIIGTTQAGLKELRNTVSLMDYVPAIADGYERPLTLVGILPCAVPAAGRAYKEALDLAGEVFGADVLLPAVRRSVAVTEAHAERVPLTARTRWAPVTDDYRAVVAALVSRGVIAADATVGSGA